MNFSLKIPVTDYQYKLLTHMLGKSPYKCNFKNNLGKMISSVFMYGDDNPKVSIHKPGDKVFEIEIPNSWLIRYGVRYISEKSISDFIEMQDRLFKKQLYQYINIQQLQDRHFSTLAISIARWSHQMLSRKL